jgi:hypothetical protein
MRASRWLDHNSRRYRRKRSEKSGSRA